MSPRLIATLTSLLILASVPSGSAQAQGTGVIAFPKPRSAAGSEAREAAAFLRKQAENKDLDVGVQSSYLEAADALEADPANADPSFQTLGYVFGGGDGAITPAFWGDDRLKLLTGASLGVDGDGAALYTEIGAINTGNWRLTAGTTLSAMESDADDPASDTTGAGGDPVGESTALDRFIAGGGNFSVTALRPWFYHYGSFDRHFVFLSPRGWLNIPALSSARDVRDYGGEIALDYQYHRTASADNEADPFLVFQLRGGLVYGSDEFNLSIGLEDSNDLFFYLSPSASVIVQGALKFGVSTFIGPGALDRGGLLQVSLTILNGRGNEQPAD